MSMGARAVLQREPVVVPAPPIVHGVLATPGQPLDPGIRGQMESRFHHDFSRVRVHADARAAESARAVAARAYTVGSDVVLGAGGHGRETLAHELAHVVQQSSAGGSSGPIAVANPADRHEHEAESAGRVVATGGAFPPSLSSTALSVARQGSTDKPLDFELQVTMSTALTHMQPPLRSKDADNLIAVLAWYRETHPDDAFFTVVGHREEIFLLLAPWAFNPAFVGGMRPEGAPGPSELLDSFDQALARWKADDERTRRVRRSRTPEIAGFYVREVTAFEREYEASQLVTEELPGGGIYTGPRGGVVAARRRAEAQITLSKMEAVVQAGPIATLGRVVGATSAALSGGDVQAAGERGAALGSIGDVLLPFAARGRAGAAAEEGPGRPPAAIVEKAPPKVPVPTPDVPAPAKVSTTEAFAETIPAGALAKTAPPQALGRTGTPAALAKTAPPEALGRTGSPEALAKTAPGAQGAPPPAAAQAPRGPVTQPSAPAAAPSPRQRAPARAVAVTPEEVIAQYGRDPKSVVYRSEEEASTFWFQQIWTGDRGEGKLPLAFRVRGGSIIVDRQRWPDELRAAIGLPPKGRTP